MKLKTDENKYILILYDEIGQPSVKLPSLTKLNLDPNGGTRWICYNSVLYYT